MTEFFAVTAEGLSEPLNIALLFGLMVFGGTIGSRLAQLVNFPQVVGTIIFGIILGNIGGIIHPDMLDMLEPFTMFALGMIGFMIGGELRAEVFKKYGKQFFIILISQGVGAFLLVWAGAGLLIWFITKDVKNAASMGLILGAIASATAPAATVNVLWEFKTRGPLTSAIYAIVALDDALALVLYRVAATGTQIIIGSTHASLFMSTFQLLAEIIGAVMLGFLIGVALNYFLKFEKGEDKVLALSLSALLLIVGVSMLFHIDPILPTMTLGITIANLAPRQSKGLFNVVKSFSPPIYITFFVLAGAHMEFSKLSLLMLVMIIAYSLFRAGGKVWGAWLGAWWSRAPANVRKYLGICLLPQAGVAIGLAILSKQYFEAEQAKVIIIVVMTSTFLMEILGPVFVKKGVKKAKEVGMNVTEDDLIKQYTVIDVMESKPVKIPQETPLQDILEIFSKTEDVYFPVVDSDSTLIGIITIAGIKEMFASQDVAGWLLAVDVAEPAADKVKPDASLSDTLELMERYDLDFLPVMDKEEDNKLIGILDRDKTLRKISAEVLRRRKEADAMVLAVD